MAADLASDKFWVNKNLYHDAEKKYQENLAKLHKRGQRRLEVGENSDLANTKKIKESKRLRQKNFGEGTKEELDKLEAQRNLNDSFRSDTPNRVSKVVPKDGPDCVENNLIVPDKAGKGKERTKKNTKSSKKSENIKEKDDLLGGVGMAKLNQDSFPKTTLAGEVARARQHIKSSLECMGSLRENGVDCLLNPRLNAILEKMEKSIENLTERVKALEMKAATGSPALAACSVKSQTTAPKASTKPAAKDDDDDVDLFGSDSEEEDEEAKKIREQRLAEYAAKKSKKPAVIAKSNIILDVKPWDDETDMKEMEKAVRAVQMDGLVWGASKLVPVAFKISKLQIACVIEDDKVSVDLLTETLEEITDYVQSVDIAAFNKV